MSSVSATSANVRDTRDLPGLVGLPETDRPSGPPERRLWGEVGGAVRLGSLLLRAPRLATMPRGTGAPVIDVPGWRTPEVSMAPLRAYLRWLGHDARSWGLGMHQGDPESDSHRLAPLVREWADAAGRPVALVGWSLGGVIARETARRVPDAVSQVIVFGSPLIGGPLYTSVAGTFTVERRQEILRAIEQVERENPLRVPITVMYSRRDAVVNWKACLDHTSSMATHVEVPSTHFMMGLDPVVWQVVATQLAQQPPATSGDGPR